MYEYRELLRALSTAYIKARYKQTIFGIGWAFIPSLLLLATALIVFRNLLNYSYALPYSIYIFLGLWFWTFFSNALSFSVPNLVQNTALLRKIYFPREVLIVAATVPSILDFAINTIIVLALFIYFHSTPPLVLLYAIPLFLILYFFTLGLALMLSMFNVAFRDVGKLLPILLQVLFFVSPVIYGITQITDKWRALVKINPLTGVIETMRSLVLETPPDWYILTATIAVSLITFYVGYYIFKKGEELAADIV